MSRDTRPAGSRKGRLLTSYAAATVFLAVRVGQQLLLLPAFLYVWGAQLYEQWILLSSAAAFVMLADLGTRPYFKNRLLMLASGSDLPGYRHTLRTSIGFTILLQLGAIILLIGGAALAWQADIFSGGVIEPIEATTILVLLGLRGLAGHSVRHPRQCVLGARQRRLEHLARAAHGC